MELSHLFQVFIIIKKIKVNIYVFVVKLNFSLVLLSMIQALVGLLFLSQFLKML